MSRSFRFVALEAEPFAPLFDQSDEELASLGAKRMVVDERPGFPCRVSLQDGEVGETVVLLPYTHHDVPSPYCSSGPIFVRKGVPTARPAVGEIPEMLARRLLSVRGYDAEGMMIAAEVVEGRDLESTITRLFTNDRMSYLHLHNAKPGCFNCAVVRA